MHARPYSQSPFRRLDREPNSFRYGQTAERRGNRKGHQKHDSRAVWPHVPAHHPVRLMRAARRVHPGPPRVQGLKPTLALTVTATITAIVTATKASRAKNNADGNTNVNASIGEH